MNYFLKNCNLNGSLKDLNVEDIEEKVKSDLLEILDSEDDLVSLYTDRLKLKAKVHQYYKKIRKSDEFIPYENKLVYYSENLQNLAKSSNRFSQKGYLYSSTNASSKKRHYIIGEKSLKVKSIDVDKSLINSYNQMLKDFRPPTSIKSTDASYRVVKSFYDLFHFENDSLQKVVFYTIRKGKISSIGRTPYMKVQYNYALDDYIQTEKTDKIDFSRSLFGYVEEDLKLDLDLDNWKLKNYKSRLRFEPIIINVTSSPVNKKFKLSSPKPTCFSMYLNQCNISTRKNTFNDINSELNGYKFYKVLDNQVSTSENGSFHSERMVLNKDSIVNMHCKVHFKNLTEVELGLLIMAINPQYAIDVLKEKNDILNVDLFESIGGAKPYGYGKVKISIDNEDVILNNLGDVEELSYWFGSKPIKVNDFVNVATKKLQSTVDPKVINAFIRSKISNSHCQEYINWENLHDFSDKGGGYRKDWILKRSDSGLIEDNLSSLSKNKKSKNHRSRSTPQVEHKCTLGDFFKGKEWSINND